MAVLPRAATNYIFACADFVEDPMPEIVTVPERKAREAARRRAAALDVMTEAREFARTRGGRFYVFGSVEEACQRRHLPSDVHLKSRASRRFLDRIRDQMVSLP
jgi:hypothetical protein